MRPLTRDERGHFEALTDMGAVEVGLFEVTSTQLEKSIIDANFSVRHAFAATGFHDYAAQPQGKDGKVLADLMLLTAGGLADTKISLYRPNTKAGDPRLWIYELEGLSPETIPGDLVAIAQDGDTCAAALSSLQRPLRHRLAERHHRHQRERWHRRRPGDRDQRRCRDRWRR